MTRLIARTIGAVGLFAVIAWSPASFADDEPSSDTETPAPAEATTPAAAASTASTASSGHAETPLRKHAQMGAALTLTGVLTLGLSYGPAVYVAQESKLATDRKLQVPVAGPWLDLAARPQCYSGGNCGNEGGYTALLMFDGFFQALAAIEIVAGLVEMAQEDYAAPKKATAPPKAEAASMRVSPATLGVGGYGLAAVGRF
jgi:hypothetical protein